MKLAPRRGSRFSVDPNPPVAGQPCTVTYSGDESQVDWQVDGGDNTKVSVPPHSFTIPSVPHGNKLRLSDRTGGEGFAAFAIEELR